MKIFTDIADAASFGRPFVSTIGNFDGMHRGHQAILARVLERARATKLPGILITFDPHPLKILAPERAPKMIATRHQQLAWIEAAGIECVLILPFTPHLARVTAERFVREHLARRLEVREVYVGANFNFGRGRGGNADLLIKLCADLGIKADKVPEVRYLGSPVSSSRIRRAIQSGEVELARELLGRPYSIEGRVVRGAGRGTGLGFPTANLTPENELIPSDGVYVTEAVSGDRPRASVTNVGSRPTFGEGAFTIETHLLDGDGDLYDQDLEIRFLARLRQELKFESPQALVEQVGRDVERAREYFSSKNRRGQHEG
jgi:riboflavin kinase/FMN adenylyltransferase